MKLQISNRFALVMLLFSVVLSACSSTKSPRAPTIKVPLAIVISEDNSQGMSQVGLDYYRFKLLDVLDDYPEYDPVLVEADENPAVIFNLAVQNFIVWPRDERVSRQTYSQRIQTGTNAAGQPVYQTVSATVETAQISIRSSATLRGKLTFRDSNPVKVFQQAYSPSHVWKSVYTKNVQGDVRALAGVYTGSSMEPNEPTPNDLLLDLTKEDMLDRMVSEIRSYYQKPKK